jgi:hypothetical protein
MVATYNLFGKHGPRHRGSSSDEIGQIIKIVLTTITAVVQRESINSLLISNPEPGSYWLFLPVFEGVK